MNRDRFMIAHGVDPVRWAKRYGIEPGTAPCYQCEAPRTTTMPFAYKFFRGLMAPTCECGHENGPYCMVSADGEPIADALLRLAEQSSARPKRRSNRARKKPRALALVHGSESKGSDGDERKGRE